MLCVCRRRARPTVLLECFDRQPVRQGSWKVPFFSLRRWNVTERFFEGQIIPMGRRVFFSHFSQ